LKGLWSRGYRFAGFADFTSLFRGLNTYQERDWNQARPFYNCFKP